MIERNFTPFPNLETNRFNLRQLSLDDREEIFILRSDARVMQYLDRTKAGSIEDAIEFIVKINNSISKNESIYWAISNKNEPKLIGTICLWNLSESGSQAEIGFELLPEYMGKGIMQEIIPVILDYGFNIMKLEKINGEVSPENLKSIKLMERFGFVFEDKFENTFIYSIKK